MNTTSIGNAVKQVVQARLSLLHTAFPARVETYDRATRKASVQPLIKRLYADGTAAEYPILPAVPVVMPSGGGAIIKLPVAVGDVVLVVCCERTIGKWLETGTVGTPELNHTFQLMDAVAIAGLFPFSEGSQATDDTSVEVLFNDSSIKITDGNVVTITNGSATMELNGGQVNVNNGNLTVD